MPILFFYHVLLIPGPCGAECLQMVPNYLEANVTKIARTRMQRLKLHRKIPLDQQVRLQPLFAGTGSHLKSSTTLWS